MANVYKTKQQAQYALNATKTLSPIVVPFHVSSMTCQLYERNLLGMKKQAPNPYWLTGTDLTC
jgi:hypothetical protein